MAAVGFEPTKPKHDILSVTPLTARESSHFFFLFFVVTPFDLLDTRTLWSEAGFEPAKHNAADFESENNRIAVRKNYCNRAPLCLQEDSNRRKLGNAHSPDPIPAGM